MRRLKISLFLLAVAILVALGMVQPPTDESMIKHFYANKDDIELLLHRYRFFEKAPVCVDRCLWDDSEDVAQIKIRAGISKLSFTGGSIWPPEPYTSDAYNVALKLADEIRSRNDIDKPFRRYSAVAVHLAKEGNVSWFNLKYGIVKKTYVHIPSIAKIEDGYLFWPRQHNGGFRRSRVFYSLDNPSINLSRGECVFRKLEQHWFICLCDL